jgi:hypothetical protein
MNNPLRSSPELKYRPYQPGDEVSILELLNIGFEVRFDLDTWKWRYINFPSFRKENVLIVESDRRIMGHRGMFQREMCLGESKVPTVTFGDSTVHPDFRGKGVYSQIWQVSTGKTRAKGTCLLFGFQSKDSLPNILANRKLGFMEVPQIKYVKILNPKRVFKAYLKKWMRTAVNREVYDELKHCVAFHVEADTFSLGELGDEEFTPQESTVEISIKESAMPLLMRFMVGHRLERMKCLLGLLLSGKMTIKFTSLGPMFRLIKAGVRILV